MTTPKAPDIVSEFPGTFPIGVDDTGRLALVYLVTVPWTEDFRLFLLGHIRLLAVTPVWTLRLDGVAAVCSVKLNMLTQAEHVD